MQNHMRPKAFSLVKKSINDAIEISEKNRAIPAMLFLVLLSQNLINAIFVSLKLNSVAAIGAGIIAIALQVYISAPVSVAVHRNVAWQQNTPAPWKNYREDATLSFWGWSFFWLLLVQGTSIIYSFLLFGKLIMSEADLPQTYIPSGGGIAAFLVLMIAVLYVSVRMISLPPMAALQPGQVSLAGAFRQTKGLFWRIFWAVILLSLFWGVLSFATTMVLGLITGIFAAAGAAFLVWIGVIFVALVMAFLSTISVISFLSLASQVYMFAKSRDEAEAEPETV